jgi:hypothetical protein
MGSKTIYLGSRKFIFMGSRFRKSGCLIGQQVLFFWVAVLFFSDS